MVAPRTLGLFALATVLAACAGSTDREGFAPETSGSSATTPPPAPSGDFGSADAGPRPDDQPAPEVHEVYGHSATTLYKLEPATKAVTVIGEFKGCSGIFDIALDENSLLYAVSADTLYAVDKGTASCTTLGKGKYPTSLSFVPKGTVDPDEEALVGYDGSTYIRIDVNTGQRTNLGSLGGTYVSSGDIVSVKGGSTYLTVKGGTNCKTTDCLVEVDPKSGKLLKNWGDIEHAKVFGLSFWGGKVYGFDNAGELFEVTFGSSKIVTTTIAIPQKPSDLSFWGAGSSTSAPLVADPQ